jgi:hypothetical protein
MPSATREAYNWLVLVVVLSFATALVFLLT